ncbi:MAG: flagellar basal body rod protein FlgB [Hyphomicrobiaceae bacterium]
MADLALFSIASDRTRWLATRSAALADNIANADTPGYKARDVPSFEAALNSANAAMLRTNANHLAPTQFGARTFELVNRPGEVPKHSGNTVSLEVELANLGEVRSQHSLVSGVIGAFHRMLLSSVKG